MINEIDETDDNKTYIASKEIFELIGLDYLNKSLNMSPSSTLVNFDKEEINNIQTTYFTNNSNSIFIKDNPNPDYAIQSFKNFINKKKLYPIHNVILKNDDMNDDDFLNELSEGFDKLIVGSIFAKNESEANTNFNDKMQKMKILISSHSQNDKKKIQDLIGKRYFNFTNKNISTQLTGPSLYVKNQLLSINNDEQIIEIIKSVINQKVLFDKMYDVKELLSSLNKQKTLEFYKEMKSKRYDDKYETFLTYIIKEVETNKSKEQFRILYNILEYTNKNNPVFDDETIPATLRRLKVALETIFG